MSSACKKRIMRGDDFRAPDFIPAREIVTPRFSLVETQRPAPLPPSTLHYHESYEFLAPHRPMTIGLGSGGEHREVQLPANRLFPFNPGQEHGTSVQPVRLSCHAFMVDRALVSEAAEAMGATGSVEFANDECAMTAKIRALTHLFRGEARGRQAGHEFLLELTAAQLTMYFLRACQSNIPRRDERACRFERDGIARVIEFFHDNLTHQYSLNDVTGVAGMDRYRFIRAFRVHTGKTPQQYLTDLKIERACQYLKHSTMTMTEICIACGFSDPSQFATVFKRRMGVPPSEYRRQSLI